MVYSGLKCEYVKWVAFFVIWHILTTIINKQFITLHPQTELDGNQVFCVLTCDTEQVSDSPKY